jgi:putative sigma-54 modulation protein
MKLNKSEDKSNKVVEMKINVPGTYFFAKEQSHSFEAATDDAVEALRRQLRKHKGKITEKR